MTASQSDEKETVGGVVKKASKLAILVLVGSLLKFAAQVTHAAPMTTPKLMAGHAEPKTKVWPPPEMFEMKEDHPDSFYDPSSSHYMGGAHNVALARLSDPENTIK